MVEKSSIVAVLQAANVWRQASIKSILTTKSFFSNFTSFHWGVPRVERIGTWGIKDGVKIYAEHSKKDLKVYPA